MALEEEFFKFFSPYFFMVLGLLVSYLSKHDERCLEPIVAESIPQAAMKLSMSLIFEGREGRLPSTSLKIGSNQYRKC